jgi:hypothetical protein
LKDSNPALLGVPIGPPSATECTVTNITVNTTWTSTGGPYILYGDVRVNNGATLTIQAGTVVRGDKTSGGTLTIERGARIIAVGTSTSPIVFTSGQPAGARAPKDWGGIRIMGKAPSNQVGLQSAGGYRPCVTAPVYGDTLTTGTCNYSSGVLSYVRIEFAGRHYQASADPEVGGLSLCCVGYGTKIDHIQVSYSGDDGFLWSGGCSNANYLISYRNEDDDFDSDNGYSGAVQFGIAVRDPALADQSGSNGFESDTDADGINPIRTTALFSNFTLVGPYDPACVRMVATGSTYFSDGLHLRRNTGIDVHNTIITG